MYHSPRTASFPSSSLVDLLGPVETQYATCETCLIDPQQTSVVNGTQVTAVLNIAGCTEFEACSITVTQPVGLNTSIPCAATPETFLFNRADGSGSGNQWQVVFNTQQDFCGEVDLDVTLSAPGKDTATCSLTVPVQLILR